MTTNNKNQNVLLEGEEELLLDHDYDGIQELNNPLPGWWKMTFYGGIVFAIFYFLFYAVLGGPTLMNEYQRDLARVEKLRAELMSNADYFEIQEYQAWVVGNQGHKMGETIYMENCMACHLEQGQGDIGPNLTDAYWIHGDGGVESNYRIVLNGVEEQGMPPWGEFLSREEIYAVVDFIDNLKNTNIPGKEPEGERVD